MNQRMRFLQKRIAAVEAEKHGAVVLVHELAKTWWGRIALRLALNRIEGEA